METDKKTFTVNDKTVLFSEATNSQVRLAESQASRKFAELFSDKNSPYMLREKLYAKLEQDEIISKDDVERAERIIKSIDENKKKIARKEITKSSEMRELLIKNIDLQSELLTIYSQRQKYEDLTLEKHKEDEYLHWLMCQTAKYEDGSDVFSESPSEVDRNSKLYNDMIVAFNEYLYGTDDDIENGLIEIRLLRKFGFIDDNNNYIDRQTKNRVDKDGNPVDYETLTMESMEDYTLED